MLKVIKTEKTNVPSGRTLSKNTTRKTTNLQTVLKWRQIKIKIFVK